MKHVSRTIVAQEIGNEASRGRAIYVRTLLGFTFLAILGGIALVAYQYRGQSALVEKNALHSAAQHSTALTEFRTLYTTEVVAKARQSGLEVSHDFRGRSDTIPLPATMSILLGEKIAAGGFSIKSKIYSPYPFPWHQEGGLADDFAEEAWKTLSSDSSGAFHRFESMNGTRVLRYATADIMRDACVSCHNEHPESPKTDWKTGDLRGVLEVVVPIDAAMSQTRTSVQESTIITVVIVILGLVTLGFAARRLRRAAIHSESRVKKRTDELDRSNRTLRKQMAELEKAEQAVRISQAQYQSLVETIPMNVLRKDLEGRFTFANQRFCESLGRPLSEIIGKDDSSFFPADLAEKFRADDLAVVESKKTVEAVEENYTPDGKRIYVHVMKSPVIDAKGEVIGVQAVFWDVTRQKRAEESVQRSERRYRQLTEGAMDAIVVTDTEGIVTLFNSAAERCFGYKQDEIIGKSVDVLLPESLSEAHPQGFERYVQNGNPGTAGSSVELTGRRKNGEEFNLDLSVSSIELPEGPGLLAIIRDSSERHRMHRRVEQSEKLASLGMLSAGVAHEINNPLSYVANNMMVLTRDVLSIRTALSSYRRLLAQGDVNDDERRARAQEIAKVNDLDYIDDNIERILETTNIGVQRVAEIVNNLRGFARLDSAETNRVDLREAVRAAHEMIRGQLERRNIELKYSLEGISDVIGKQAQLNQVILNLLVNAMQAIDVSGANKGLIEVRGEEKDGEIIVQVLDDGPGFAPGTLDKIFDPFFTTKAVGEGTGLGLSISHGIIADHGGRIEAGNRPQGGAIFRVHLKRAD